MIENLIIFSETSFEKKDIINGRIVKDEINTTIKAIIITIPKSITGLISDITKDKKATTVVRNV